MSKEIAAAIRWSIGSHKKPYDALVAKHKGHVLHITHNGKEGASSKYVGWINGKRVGEHKSKTSLKSILTNHVNHKEKAADENAKLSDAFKNSHGQLHKALHVDPDEPIPAGKLKEALHSKNPKIRKMALPVENMKKAKEKAMVTKEQIVAANLKAMEKAAVGKPKGFTHVKHAVYYSGERHAKFHSEASKLAKSFGGTSHNNNVSKPGKSSGLYTVPKQHKATFRAGISDLAKKHGLKGVSHVVHQYHKKGV